MSKAEAQDSGDRNASGSLDLELLQSISLAVAKARDVETVLRMIVTGLADDASCTLARIWLVAPGDICERCAMRGGERDSALWINVVHLDYWST